MDPIDLYVKMKQFQKEVRKIISNPYASQDLYLISNLALA